MSAQIFGIGIGSFILFSVWTVALILSLIALRTEKLIGIISVTGASVITLILLLIPIDSKDTIIVKETESDYQFIWRALLATILSVSSLGSIILFLSEHCTSQLNAKPVQNWIIN